MGYKSKFEAAPFGLGASSSVAGDLYVNGEIYANSYHVDVVTKTITNIDQSGATKFGDTSDDLHQMTGTLSLSGSSLTSPFAAEDAHLDLQGTNPVISATGGSDTAHLHVYSDAVLYLGSRNNDAVAIGRPTPAEDEFVTAISPIFIHHGDRNISISGSMSWKARESFTATGKASPYIQIIGVDTSATVAFSIEIPSATGSSGQVLLLKDEGGNCNTENVTITTFEAETIDGNPTALLDNDYESINLYSNGTNWFIW